MDPFFDETHIELRTRVRTWVDKNLLAKSRKTVDDMELQARSLLTTLGNEGLIAYVAPKGFGGVRHRVQARDLCLIREQLARGSALADVMFAMQALGGYAITLAGTAHQKTRYLAPI